MTRFARAKGSKSSNEKLPEESTSWHVMKQQLQPKYQESSKFENAKENELMRSDFKNDALNSGSTTWADIENSEDVVSKTFSGKKLKKQKSQFQISDLKSQKQQHSKKHSDLNFSISKPRSDKIRESAENANNWDANQDEHEKPCISKNKKKRQRKKKNLEKKVEIDTFNTSDELVLDTSDMKKKENNTLSKNNCHKDRNTQKAKQNKSEETTFHNKQGRNNKSSVNIKKRKLNDRQQQNTPFKRRKPDEQVQIFYLNGRSIEIVKFDGFPVKKEDAENLKLLKESLIAKGIPKDEIEVTMKLERRKAEKALTREKKKNCFHCRMSGHVLSECPELENKQSHDSTMAGICFKCGSTEHTHSECRVVKEQDFRFAKCFVCNEQGHISRQCPDNPKGLYPKGGACRECGDVTHLKKDCPTLLKTKEETTIRLQTLDSQSLEELDEDLQTSTSNENKINKKKKVIKF